MREVWALKYRPQTMSQLLGQEIPKRIIYGALCEPEVPAAFLLAGNYGAGKTSIARIIGRILTCENLTPQKEACGTCWNCKLDLGRGESPNYQEQDAASAGHVDDIEQLLEDARLAPVNAERRVLVLDEAQMLSLPAQNKLLKSLEEGIGKTCILMVTTHPDKLIPTIRSRCINLNITPVEGKIVLGFLRDIVTQEGKNYEEEALELIVDQTRGHIRNTLNLAYQISLYGSITLLATKSHLNLHIEDQAASLLVCTGESWDATVKKVEDLVQEASPEDLWNSVRRIVGQAFLCVSQPSSRWSESVRKIADQHGIRLATVAEWSVGEGARLYIRTRSDLLVGLAVLRDRLGVATVVREAQQVKKAGVPKSEQHARGMWRERILTEEKVVDLLGLTILSSENGTSHDKNGENPP